MYLQSFLGYGKKKKEYTDPHLLFLSASKMKEVLVKLFDKIFPLYGVPGNASECIHGQMQHHSYDRL